MARASVFRRERAIPSVSSVVGQPERECRILFSAQTPDRCAPPPLPLGSCPHPPLRLLFWSMSTLPLSEVKARLSEIADEVDRTHDRVHVTRNGRDYVVLLSAEDLESLEATIELLRDDAGMERIRAADAAVATGDVTTAADMSALMDERRQREHRDG